MTNEETSYRLGTHGNIQLRKGGCNATIGKKGLEQLGEKLHSKPIEYISSTNHQSDLEINIKKFGGVLQDGIDNTKEMAEKWKWYKDNQEFNWREKPVELRISYNTTKEEFKIQVWNELFQIWLRLSLTKKEILKILVG